MLRNRVICFTFLALLCTVFSSLEKRTDGLHVFSAHYGGRPAILPSRAADPTLSHSVTFSIRLKNLDKLEEILYDVSSPSSGNYGKHWKKEEIMKLIGNQEASSVVEQYLKSRGVSIVNRSLFGEFITAVGKIEVWERIFSTKFHEFYHDDWTSSPLSTAWRSERGAPLIRSLQYSLTDELLEHVDTIFNVADFPPVLKKIGSSFSRSSVHSSSLNGNYDFSGFITPQSLFSHYAVNPKLGNSFTSQAAFQSLDQNFVPSDLTAFQTFFNLTVQGLASSYGGHVSNTACKKGNDDLDTCSEANLDAEYLMAIAQGVPTSSLYWDGGWVPFLTYLQSLSSSSSPARPDVVSISYGNYESDFSQSYIQTFNNLMLQLGVMGVSVLVASGDDGVSGYKTASTSQCGYNPMFPASSPYVTTIGATQVSETGCFFSFFLFSDLFFRSLFPCVFYRAQKKVRQK
jgi:tripeptidyl-peptidase-1